MIKDVDQDIEKKMVGLIIDGTDIDNDVFDELCDIIYSFSDITDIKVNLKNEHQLDEFMKTIKHWKMVDQITFVNPKLCLELSRYKQKSFKISYCTDKDGFVC